MADLQVDTGLLRTAAAELTSVAATADRVGNGHARLGEVVAASGSHRAANGLDSFLCSWTYGVRCIATQAGEVGHQLTSSAVAFESVEAMLTAAAAGRDVASGTFLSPSTLPRYEEPLRPAPRLLPVTVPPMQLATAMRVTDLIPGDPEQVAVAGRLMTRFADELADARLGLARVTLGSWVGASARVMAGELEKIASRLSTAEHAFAEAGTAVSAYARVHRDAQADAARALQIWQAAKPAADAARGAVVTADPVAPIADPEGELRRAAVLYLDARDQFDAAGRSLSEILRAAETGSPNDPGLFARIGRAITSLGTGLTEGVWGMGEGAVTLARLSVQLVPTRAIYDPSGYLATYEAMYSGFEYILSHPIDTLKEVTDWDTWREDPALALGRIVPDLIAIGMTAGAAGATRGAAASERLSSAAAAIEEAQASGRSLFNSVDDVLAARRVSELGFDPTSAAGRVIRGQLEPPFGGVDHWVPTHLSEGDRVLIDSAGVMSPVRGQLPVDARTWFEDLQSPPLRGRLPDGSVTLPSYESRLFIYEIGEGGLDAASATALANPQFGPGGGIRLAVEDLQQAIADGRLVSDGTHLFDRSTLEAAIEDPRFRATDPGLPNDPLDPDIERIRGRVNGGLDELRETGRGMLVGAGASETLDQLEEGTP